MKNKHNKRVEEWVLFTLIFAVSTAGCAKDSESACVDGGCSCEQDSECGSGFYCHEGVCIETDDNSSEEVDGDLDVSSNSDSDTDTDSDGDTDGESDSDKDDDSEKEDISPQDSDSDSDSESDADSDLEADMSSDSDTDADSDSDSDVDSDSDSDSDTDSDNNSDDEKGDDTAQSSDTKIETNNSSEENVATDTGQEGDTETDTEPEELTPTDTAVPTDTEVESTDPDERRFLLRDEGNSALHYVDLTDDSNNWNVSIPAGRDMQLVGSGRVLIGTENGYQEHDIATGEKVAEVTNYSGTIAARRLRNGNTMLVHLGYQGQDGIVLVEIDGTGSVARTINYTGYGYVRLARETPDGTFLMTSDTKILEGNEDGQVIWEVTVANSDEPHAWMAVRLASGDTVVSCGYAQSLQIFSPNESLTSTISGPQNVNPHFYAGFQVMDSGNYVVTNWQGHGAGYGTSGIQVLEYNPSGDLVWHWQQDASYVSSLQAIIVLNGLDVNKLHVEGVDGTLVPVEQ